MQEAEKGDVKAMLLMGAMHQMGRLVEQNHTEAVKWFSKVCSNADPFPLEHTIFSLRRSRLKSTAGR